MNFFQAIKVCHQKEFCLKGRASRAEFWWFKLFFLIFSLVVEIFLGSDFIYQASKFQKDIVYFVIFAIYVNLCIIEVTVSVRRLHDINRSGYWIIAWWFALMPITIFIAAMFGAMLGMADAHEINHLYGYMFSIMNIISVVPVIFGFSVVNIILSIFGTLHMDYIGIILLFWVPYTIIAIVKYGQWSFKKGNTDSNFFGEKIIQ